MQRKLLEFFVLEVTARSAADILGIQPNSAMLFYKKVRQVIEYHLSQEADEIPKNKEERTRFMVLLLFNVLADAKLGFRLPEKTSP